MEYAPSKPLTEITPLSEKDFFYLIDRKKQCFDYPVHSHAEYELNFVANARGAKRIVGDSVESIGDYDLVLVGHGIEHAWEQGDCTSNNIHEVTMQFSKDFLGSWSLSRTQFTPIRDMLEKAAKGIAFSQNDIMRVFHRLENLRTMPINFYRVAEFLLILHELAISEDARTLSSSSFAKAEVNINSRRIQKVYDYISEHYKEEIRLETLAELVNMTPTAFSRFFKHRTGKTVSDLIIDIRLGFAARGLLENSHTISEVCYECGFNSISYFNRIFKKRKGFSPKEFRETYKRNNILV